MITQASNLHSQLYQLAYSTAKLAERAYQRELAVPESSYITFGYWDSLRKGLLAGERLQLGIRQLERAYIDQNEREYEITRYVSLLLHDPGRSSRSRRQANASSISPRSCSTSTIQGTTCGGCAMSA